MMILRSIPVLLAGLLLVCQSAHAAETVDAKYRRSCATCHDPGVLGASKKGDTAAWAARLRKGMPTLVDHVTNGFNNMPARGLCNDCSEADYRALIEFMSQ